VSRPRLLDLFCGAGGAAMGYHRAGFDVVGVDIVPQPHYPFAFEQGDALVLGERMIASYDAIHASPPCQAYSTATRDHSLHPDLYAPTRDLLVASGLPYVIENVIGAPYSHGVVLCGSMFGLTVDGEWVRRHRNFEGSQMLMSPGCAHPKGRRPINVTGNSFTLAVKEWEHSRQGPFALAERLMGIDWMTRDELGQAIPPAYTEFIGAQLLRAVTA
jgi:DNA (cytosine-5)-methyltransferase 1